MAATHVRSNANSPRSPDQFVIERRQTPSPFPFATSLQDFTRDQLLGLIHEARQQASISGASPAKISSNYKFLDAANNPRFAPSTIAEWIALPSAGIEGWLDAARQDHVTLRQRRVATASGQHSGSATSRSSSPVIEVDYLHQELTHTRAQDPAQTSVTHSSRPRASSAVTAARAKLSVATVVAARAAAASAAARAAAAAAEAEAAVAAAAAVEEAARAASATGTAAAASRTIATAAAAAARGEEEEEAAEGADGAAGVDPAPLLHSGFGSPRSAGFLSRPGSPGAASGVESLHRQVADLQSALAAANTATASARASTAENSLIASLVQQITLLSARLAELSRPTGPWQPRHRPNRLLSNRSRTSFQISHRIPATARPKPS
jgi:hypothetical protein